MHKSHFPFSISYGYENENECIVTFFSFEIKQSFLFLWHFISRLIFQQTFIFFDIRDIFYSRETKSCMVSIWWCMKNRVFYRGNSFFFRFDFVVLCSVFAGCSFLLRRHFNWFQYFILLQSWLFRESMGQKHISNFLYFLFVWILAKDFETLSLNTETDATAVSIHKSINCSICSIVKTI